MNDDYDNHIIQKYRLAVAIAIIRNTPQNSTPKKYLERIRNNIITDMEPYDPDMTICEDDFILDEIDDNKIDANNESQLLDSQGNESLTILKDFDFNEMIRNANNDKDIMENNSVTDVLRILKGVNNDETTEIGIPHDNGSNLNHAQSTYCSSSHTPLQQTKGILNEDMVLIQHFQKDPDTAKLLQPDSNNETMNMLNLNNTITSCAKSTTNYDSQKNAFHRYTDNFTHVSQSQLDNTILPRYLLEKEKPKGTKSKSFLNETTKNCHGDMSRTLESKNASSVHRTLNSIDKKLEIDVTNNNDNKKHKFPNNTDNIQAKRSRNIDENMNPKVEATHLNKISNLFNVSTNATNSELVSIKNLKTVFNEVSGNKLDKTNNVIVGSLHDFNDKIEADLNNDKMNLDLEKRNNYDNFNFELQTSIESNEKPLVDTNLNFSQFSQEFLCEPSINIKSSTQKETEEAKELELEEEQNIEDLFDKLTDSQTDVVPFKVLEELNKVKSFLSNRDRRASSDCGSDSGYKSDSLSKASFKTAYQWNVCMNQSAYCLVNHIRRCPLVVNTEQITKEISSVLGRLVDRLHEDEKYPSFLEEHLQFVDTLLKEIYEEESADKLLEKDEKIHRLLLLNKSSHIIKYSIEKIILILEDVIAKLADEELLEISRTTQTENLSYIFHILETLIKKLVIHKNLSSQQSTQNSQEDEGVLKKSSITDIWRRKWNLVKKCDTDATSGAKPCVLARCGEVLNKIIVQAMDGYTLISYFALQCFNLLQN